MHPKLDSFDAMHARISKLEKQNREIKQLGAAALVVVVSLLVMGQAPAKKTVEANEFILKDGNGKVRARLRMGEEGFSPSPELVLTDEKRGRKG